MARLLGHILVNAQPTRIDSSSDQKRFSYLRSLLVQAARVLLLWPAKWRQHSFGEWLTAASMRLHHNVLAAALANKLARIAWSVLSQNRTYEPRTAAAAG